MISTLLLALAAVAAQDADALIKAGNELLDREDAKAALLKFEKAAGKFPDRADAYLGRGRALGKLNLHEDAENDFNRALELDPTLGAAYFFRSRLRARRDAHLEALSDLDQSLARGIQDPRVFTWKGVSLNKLARHAEAEEQFSRSLSEGPTAVAYSGRAWARMVLGNLRGAISDEVRSIELDPADQEDYYRRAMAYYGVESWDNAVRDLRKVGELQPVAKGWAAHWIFLCGLRKGEKEASIQELREFLKANETSLPSPWLRKLLAYDLGELSDEKLLEETKEAGLRSLAELSIGTRRLVDGKVEESLQLFRKSAEASPKAAGYTPVLAREEIRRQWRRKLEGVVQDLETKVRKLPVFEATYELDIQWAPDEETAIRRIVWTADMARKRSALVVRGRNEPKKADIALWMLLVDHQMYSWDESDAGFYRVDFSFVTTLAADLEQEISRLLPPGPDAKPEPDQSTPNLTLQLSGKSSKEESGTIRFATGMASWPCNWLKELPGPDEVFREEQDEIVFGFPAARKKVIIDRRTGLLKLLETLDYDGTRRSIRLVATKELGAWPKIDPPAKEKPAPYDVARFRTQMIQQENILQGEVSAIVQRWDELVRGKKDDPAAAIVTRWAAQYSDGFHANAVRTLAARRIKSALDLGTPVSTLVQNGAADAQEFATQVSQDRKSIDDYLKSNLAELAERTENGLFEWPIDSRFNPTVRMLVKKALDPQTVERQRKATFGDRFEELYRDELRTRTQL